MHTHTSLNRNRGRFFLLSLSHRQWHRLLETNIRIEICVTVHSRPRTLTLCLSASLSQFRFVCVWTTAHMNVSVCVCVWISRMKLSLKLNVNHSGFNSIIKYNCIPFNDTHQLKTQNRATAATITPNPYGCLKNVFREYRVLLLRFFPSHRLVNFQYKFSVFLPHRYRPMFHAPPQLCTAAINICIDSRFNAYT